VVIRNQQRRWACCDARGTLRVNWRIVQAPMRLVDYVVAHELVHLRHKQHSKAFWAVLGRAMPDYERRREDLRRIGTKLEW
jgi:predicted metal-dependent hydrolase